MRYKKDVSMVDCLLKGEISERENAHRGRKLQKTKLTMIEGVLMNEN